MGISTGIAALTSAITPLHSHTLLLCVLALGLLALAILTLVNLRGVSERGGFFPFPTYLFLACIAVVLALGIAKTVASGGHPAALIRPPSGKAAAAFSFWLVIKAYGSGCTALTGMEAVSNGVSAFRGDRVKNAQRTLGLIVFALAIMLAGIAVLVKHFNCCNGPEWEKLSKCSFYFVRGCYGSWVVLLCGYFSFRFTDFFREHRFCRFSSCFSFRWRRRVSTDCFRKPEASSRIYRRHHSFDLLTAALLIAFGGIMGGLIPLFAIGAFLALMMSQAGMVVHWKREGGKGAWQSMALNLMGAIATGSTVLIVIVAKFSDGAWITLLAIPRLLFTYGVHRHYEKVRREIDLSRPLLPDLPRAPQASKASLEEGKWLTSSRLASSQVRF